MPEFDFRDPKNQKMIATFLIPVVALLAFYNFMVQPKMNALDVQKAEYSSLETQLNQIQNMLQPREQLELQREGLVADLAEVETLLPTEENVALLLDQLAAVEKAAGVYLVGFHATDTIESGDRPYRSNRYEVTVEAGYHQFARFMTELLSLPRILSFSDIRISQNPMADQQRDVTYEGLEDQPRYLTVECVLTTYVYQPTGDDES